MKKPPSKIILLITGAFVTHHCWDEWIPYFQSNGYTTLAPPWPHKDESAEALRNHSQDAQLASNRLALLTEYYADIIKRLPEKPILIGHSIGGLLVQLLLQRGLGTLGVAIHSVPPQGIVTFKFSFLKAGWGPLGFFTSTKKPFLMTFKQWQYAFTNGISIEEQKAGYYKLAIPESKRIVRDTITSAAKVDFKRAHEPLLFVAGSSDHTIPASLNHSNFRKYKHISSVTDYKEFEGGNHFVLGQSSWKEKADYILNWIKNSDQPDPNSKSYDEQVRYAH